jgi:hypothetical protein
MIWETVNMILKRGAALAIVILAVIQAATPSLAIDERLAARGFVGVEKRVVDAIARWVKRARPE